MKLKHLAAVAAFVTGFAASAANAVMIDFNAFNEGDIVGNEAGLSFDFGDGISGILSSSNLGSNATGDIVIFDTNAGSASVGNDADLQSPFVHVDDATVTRSFGNALVLQETNAAAPDDASRGGEITFRFDAAVEFVSIAILDGADNGSNVRLFLDGTEIASGLGGGDNQFDDYFASTPTLITAFSVDFGGSGAIGEFAVNVPAAVPAPPALALLLLGLAGLGGVRRLRALA